MSWSPYPSAYTVSVIAPPRVAIRDRSRTVTSTPSALSTVTSPGLSWKEFVIVSKLAGVVVVSEPGAVDEPGLVNKPEAVDDP